MNKKKKKTSGILNNLGRGPDEKQRVQAGGCWKSPGYTEGPPETGAGGRGKDEMDREGGFESSRHGGHQGQEAGRLIAQVSGLGDCGSR